MARAYNMKETGGLQHFKKKISMKVKVSSKEQFTINCGNWILQSCKVAKSLINSAKVNLFFLILCGGYIMIMSNVDDSENIVTSISSNVANWQLSFK